jgi:hypothetical protein
MAHGLLAKSLTPPGCGNYNFAVMFRGRDSSALEIHPAFFFDAGGGWMRSL